ncbi:MAG: hypothetical protein WDM89_06570 [Rhizomicrobium sp.]
MIRRVASLAALAGAMALSCVASAATTWNGQPVKPMFTVGPNHLKAGESGKLPPGATLQTFTGTYTDLTGHTITYRMVGSDPTTSNTATHIKMVVIPVIMVYGASNGNKTFDPTAQGTGGFKKKSVIKMFSSSPLVDDGADFKSGSIDLGSGQYVDEFQRATFWGAVSTNTGYHTILDLTKVKKLKPLTINVSSSQGSVMSNPFGSGQVGTMAIGSFDAQLNSYMSGSLLSDHTGYLSVVHFL